MDEATGMTIECQKERLKEDSLTTGFGRTTQIKSQKKSPEQSVSQGDITAALNQIIER